MLDIDIARFVLFGWEFGIITIWIHWNGPVDQIEVDVIHSEVFQGDIEIFLDSAVIGAPKLGLGSTRGHMSMVQ